MIYELRTYTLKPGTQPEYLRANKELGREIRGDRFGTLVGAWMTETGGLNQYVHLWSYPSPDERERLRAALAKDERWTKEYVPVIRPMMLAQENTLLTLDGDIGLRSVEGAGHVYEMRTYRAIPGQLGTWASALKEALPAREQYSKIVGLWTVEVGSLNTAVHLWVY
ncbi:MAG: NIPSNAP family protein, partial [Chloroflexota bacterium]|nr:NIPSNAP family protein [Chloroflexota bacterium]